MVDSYYAKEIDVRISPYNTSIMGMEFINQHPCPYGFTDKMQKEIRINGKEYNGDAE